MIFFWTRLGFLVPVITVGGFVSVGVVANYSWLKALVLLLSGLVIFLIGYLCNRKYRKIYLVYTDDELREVKREERLYWQWLKSDSDNESDYFEIEPMHTFMFIPMEFWVIPIVLMALGLAINF